MVRLSKRQPPVPAVCVLFRLIWNSICNQNAFFLLMNRYTCASTQSLYVTRVPKNLGGLRPPQEVVPARLKRGLRAETGGILVPIAALPSELTTKAKALGSKISFEGAKILYFSREKRHGVEKSWENLLLKQRC